MVLRMIARAHRAAFLPPAEEAPAALTIDVFHEPDVAAELFSISRRARPAAMPISMVAWPDEILRSGESKRVILNGSPTTIPRSGSNLTAQRLKYGEPSVDTKYSSRPFGDQRGLSTARWFGAIRIHSDAGAPGRATWTVT
jgi:hypothetical protein